MKYKIKAIIWVIQGKHATMNIFAEFFWNFRLKKGLRSPHACGFAHPLTSPDTAPAGLGYMGTLDSS